VESDGRVQLGGPTLGGLDGTLTVYNVNSTTEGIVVHGVTSQTANMTTWVDSNDEPLAEIDKDGFLHIHNSGVEFDETNYEEAVIGWKSSSNNYLSIHTDKGGTGTAQKGIAIGGPRGVYSSPNVGAKAIVVGAGPYTAATGVYAAVIGGRGNAAHGSNAAIAGGYANQAQASSQDCFVGGGFGNTLAPTARKAAAIGGQYQVIRTTYSVAMAGRYNEINARGIGGGGNANARSAIIGGKYNFNRAPASVIIGGNNARSRIYGEVVQGGGNLNVYSPPGNPLYRPVSEIQRRSVIVSAQTTDETGTAGYEGYTLLQPHAKTNEHVIILPSSTWAFTANVSAYNKDTDACAGYIFQGCVKKDGGDPEVVGVITSQSWADTSMTGIMPKIDIDTTNQSLAVLVSGLPSNTISWGAFIDCMQVRGSGDAGV
ncbi:MAG: hypothetical protein ACXADH_15620, partial [Candidatus Kariarchaeaceae archaeon]